MDLTESLPGVRPGDRLWRLLVVDAHLVFATILVPLVLAVVPTTPNRPSTASQPRPR